MTNEVIGCWVDLWVNPVMPDITACCFVRCKFNPVANFSEMNDAEEAQPSRARASTNVPLCPYTLTLVGH